MIMYDKIGHYEIDMRPYLTEKGTLDLDKAHEAYKKIALKIIAEQPLPEKELRHEYFNFFCNISALRGKELAAYLNVQPGQISQWRRNKEKDISPISWLPIRIFFADLFENGRVTNKALISNYEHNLQHQAV